MISLLEIVNCNKMNKLAGLKYFSEFLLLHSILQIVSVESHMVGNNPYHRAETLDPQGKYRLEWLVDLERKNVTFNVLVETTGYVGFGLSSYGKMSGADIVIGGVNRDGSSYFLDRHAIGYHTPEVDPSQDWVLHSARENQTHTFLSFSRIFDTCDPQDYPITEDKISLIWAYGERDSIRYHHGDRGEYRVYLIGPDYTPLITRDPRTDLVKVAGTQSDIEVWTISTKFDLPTDGTTYICNMHKAPVLSRKHHAIGWEVRFPTPEGRHLHHVIFYRCNAPAGRDGRRMFDQWIDHRGQTCLAVKAPTGPMPTEYCTETLLGYALGGKIYFHPPNIGMPIGDTPDEYYLTQMHYDNSDNTPGLVVESHLNIYYTSNIRPIESGLLNLRHESPGLPPSLLIPPFSIDHKTYGMCGPSCTRNFFPEEGITIFGLLTHAHTSGRRMRLHHFRNNKELPWIVSDDTYSFDFQQFRALNRPVKVLPGDQLVIRFSTSQEMCAGWILYHTKLHDYQQCSSEIDSPGYRQHFLGVTNVTWQNSRLEYVVDPPHRLSGLTITEVSDNHVNWDLERRDALQKFQLEHPYVNRCPTELYARARTETEDVHGKLSDGTSENSGDQEGPLLSVSYPTGAVPYRPTQSCSFQHNHT